MSYGPPPYPPQYPQQYPSQYPPYPGAYPPPGMMAPPQPSGGCSCGFMAMIVLGVCVVLCCGGGGAMYYFGMSVLQEKAKEHLARDPAVKQHIGSIRQMKFVSSHFISVDETEYVFELIGERGGGKATFVLHDDDGILEGDLELPDGTSVPLGQ